MSADSWDNTGLPDRLKRRLKSAGPPGPAARRPFAPQLSYGRHDAPPRSDARQAAVLLLLYRHDGRWHLPLTRRPESLSVHSGQVSLPGGEIETKETPEQAAVRELGEELGVVPPDLEMVGRLSPIHVYASNFHVIPCVATTGSRPKFIPNAAEVANLVEPSLVDLFNNSRVGSRAMRRRGIEFLAPDITIGGESIWGATRMILAELYVLLQGFETD